MKKTLFALTVALICGTVANAAEAGFDFDGGKPVDFVSLRQTVQKASAGLEMQEPKAVRWGNKPYYEPENSCYDLRLIDKDGTNPSWWCQVTSEHMYWYEEYNSWLSAGTEKFRYEMNFGYRQLKDGEAEFFRFCYNFDKKKSTYEIVNSPFNYEVKQRYLPNNQNGLSLEFIPKGRKERGENKATQTFEFPDKPAQK